MSWVQNTVDSLRRESERTVFRARNGIKYVSGTSHPSVGMSPKRTIWSRDKASLWRYDSDRRTSHRPLIIVFSILGRSYVLDLLPESSFIRKLLNTGQDVFLVDFGVPDGADSSNTLETYVDRYLPDAVQAALDETDSDSVDLLGYCFGGVLATLLVAGHPELPIARLAAMATPMDFAGSEGVIQALQRRKLDIDDVVDETGNVPPSVVRGMFRSLAPTSGVLSYATLWEGLWNDDFVDTYRAMSGWLGDQVPFPGACARQCIDLLVRRNMLVSGELPLGGRTVRLSSITCPLLSIVATKDHIVNPKASLQLNDMVSSEDVQTLEVPSGHVGLIASRTATSTTIPGLTTWLDHNHL